MAPFFVETNGFPGAVATAHWVEYGVAVASGQQCLESGAQASYEGGRGALFLGAHQLPAHRSWVDGGKDGWTAGIKHVDSKYLSIAPV